MGGADDMCTTFPRYPRLTPVLCSATVRRATLGCLNSIPSPRVLSPFFTLSYTKSRKPSMLPAPRRYPCTHIFVAFPCLEAKGLDLWLPPCFFLDLR